MTMLLVVLVCATPGQPAEAPSSVFRVAPSVKEIPEDLSARYAQLVLAFREGDAKRIRELSLPGSVTIGGGFPYNGYGSWERVSLRGEVNLQFARGGSSGFSADILSVTRHSEDAYFLRTATSGLSFTKTANSGWKLYAYFDRPRKYDKPQSEEGDHKSRTE